MTTGPDMRVSRLVLALERILAVENKNWPAYVRREFAEARVVLFNARRGRLTTTATGDTP